jgi:hypothetical protein
MGLAAAWQVREQDTIVGVDGVVGIRQGVARDRRISIEDPQMRHGRKTRSQRIDGYKRHVLCDLDTGLVPAVGVTPANLPEAAAADQITADLAAQGVRLGELHIDRAYLASSLIRDRDPDLQVFCKAFPVRNRGRFTKPAFTLDFDRGTLTCPNSITMAFVLGGKVQFPPRSAPPARYGSSAPPARAVAACRFTLTSGCWSSSAPRNRPRTGGPSCANGPPSSTPWPTWAAGRATAPATSGCARTCSTYAGSRSSTTSTSSPANPHQPSKPPKPDTRPAP